MLPATLANDPDRFARLSREAPLLAALNHPNIAHVYGLEEAQGARAIVMELVDGETLADRLVRGPLPVAQALSFGADIAGALAAAHDKGIETIRQRRTERMHKGLRKRVDSGSGNWRPRFCPSSQAWRWP